MRRGATNTLASKHNHTERALPPSEIFRLRGREGAGGVRSIYINNNNNVFMYWMYLEAGLNIKWHSPR